MPRKSRIDAAGAHHNMVRGIERRAVVRGDSDRDHFLERLGKILQDTQIPCYAWALMPNHVHLLLKTGTVPISTVMRRLLTSYALWFNRKHNRSGHLFQNRFKSILCQEDAYLLELVRYIHLNPVRSRMVQDLDGLDRYAYSGHSVLMSKKKLEWQGTGWELGLFGKGLTAARRAHRSFVEKGIEQGRRQDLTGGGLLRSAGGWEGVKALRQNKVYPKSDERSLGDGDFVERVLASAEEVVEKRHALRSAGFDLEKVASRVPEVLVVRPKEVWVEGKYRRRVDARSLLCCWAVRELGVSLSACRESWGYRFPLSAIRLPGGIGIAKGVNAIIWP